MLLEPRWTFRNRNWSDWAGALFSVAFMIYFFAPTQNIFSLFLIPSMGHDLLIGLAFLIRRSRKERSAPSWNVRALAYAATCLMPLFTLVARTWEPQWLQTTNSPPLLLLGVLLWLAGTAFCIWPLWLMRRSFSIEPQARQLVVSGPYTFARHPIYTSYILQYAGLLMITPSIPFAWVCGLWFVVMFFRARNEEQVLESIYLEYPAYRQTVGMFWTVPKLRSPAEA